MNEEHLSTSAHGEAVESAEVAWQEQDTSEEAVKEAEMVWMEHGMPEGAAESWSEALLTDEEIDELQSRWNSVQKNFVDAPRPSVEQADVLVAEMMERIARMSAETRATLNELWVDREDISTEDLRIAFQRYRTFFNRLLNC